MSEVSTDQVRFAWADHVNKHNEEGAQEFDAWLDGVKAQAWNEGYAEGRDVRDEDWQRPTNPYEPAPEAPINRPRRMTGP
jgi:hypothetical protein